MDRYRDNKRIFLVPMMIALLVLLAFLPLALPGSDTERQPVQGYRLGIPVARR